MQQRRSGYDVIVAGAGIVGSACALGLAQAGLRVALVEVSAPANWQQTQRDLRVVAFAPDNAQLLQDLGIWSQVLAARTQPYHAMQVWDAAGGRTLRFVADDFAQPQLGWIIENSLLMHQLWQALPQAGVDVFCPAKVSDFVEQDDSVRICLDDGRHLRAKLAVAADGRHSTLRELAHIPTRNRDDGQHGLVAYVRSEKPHQHTCWQRFLPEGPLALLPCGDALLSIVWSLPNAQAQTLCTVDAAQFNAALTQASDRCLGTLQLASARASFPLLRQLARTFVQGRLLVMGDAAHAVHPLAGQGVNLGLRDVAAFLHSVRDARKRNRAFDHPQRLARWEKSRRSDSTVSAWAFEAINTLYSTDAPVSVLLRRPLLAAAGFLPLKRALWRHAAGL